MRKFSQILFLSLALIAISKEAQANLVFPAIAHQFMVSLVVPSYYSVVLAILVLFVEALFIRKFFQRGWIYSFGLSFFVNLTSSIVGVFVVTYLEGMTREVCRGTFGYSNMRLGTYLGMIPGYFITVVLEGMLLLGSSKLFGINLNTRGIGKLSFMMNLCSYTVLFLGILFADLLTGGQSFKTY